MHLSGSPEYDDHPINQTSQYDGLAVMIVDMQKKFLSEIDRKDEKRLHETHTQVVTELCIKNKVPLINILAAYGGMQDKKSKRLYLSAPIAKTYFKSNTGAFESSLKLEEEILRMDIKKIFIMGIYATACVLRTAKGAMACNLDVMSSRDVVEEESGFFGADKINEIYSREGIKVYNSYKEFLDDIRQKNLLSKAGTAGSP